MNAVSKDRAPSAQETFAQMAQAAGLRGRILTTVGLLILARLGVYLPMPGVDRMRLAGELQNSSIIGFLDILSGGGLAAVGVFALGIIPYINASIILQLLTTALPYLERLQKEEGEAGRRKISQITRYVALGWSIVQSIGISIFLQKYALPGHEGPLFVVGSVLALVAGSMFVMWISELITERGIGNGASLLIFINIVAVFPKSLQATFALASTGDGNNILLRAGALLAVFVVMTVCIVFVQEGARQIPIISAKRQVGRRLYRERTSYLPLRLNQGGVMPIIFASSVLVLPQALSGITANGAATNPDGSVINPILNTIHSGIAAAATAMNPTGSTPWVYTSVYVLLIVFFSYFYSTLVVNPVDMAQNLKKMGASIPGVRPGMATSKYIESVLNRLTLLGSLFLGAVAIIPTVIENALGVTTFQGFGATSLLILVGVAIETAKQVQTYVISQRYEGMVKQ
jgi:preprotein translocase subunit SecY